jgi:hypothetical protein
MPIQCQVDWVAMMLSSNTFSVTIKPNMLGKVSIGGSIIMYLSVYINIMFHENVYQRERQGGGWRTGLMDIWESLLQHESHYL